MKKLTIILVSALFFTTLNAQISNSPKASVITPKVVFADDYTSATLEKILKASGIEVQNTQPEYLQINLFKIDGVSAYIDIDKDKQFLLFNGSNLLKEGTTSSQAKDLISEINAKTNLIKASYNEEKNKIDFAYYFWIKDGFTEKSFLSALEMYKLAYLYAFSLDNNEILK